jgi:hypothetical protein
LDWFEGQQQSADRDGLAGLNVDLDDLAPDRARHLQGCLAGLDFEDALIFFDHIPFFDEHFQHVTGFDAIPQVGHFDFDCHGRTSQAGGSAFRAFVRWMQGRCHAK